MSRLFYVYHIKLPGMTLDQGYIGVSQQPRERWANHKRGKEGFPVQRAISKHRKLVQFVIIAALPTREEALWLEFTLRPQPNIGWNLAVGGSLPPDSKAENNPNFGKTPSSETRKKMREARLGRFKGAEHPRARLINVYDYNSDTLIVSGVVSRTWAIDNGYHPAHLCATARGKLKQHKGVYARYC